MSKKRNNERNGVFHSCGKKSSKRSKAARRTHPLLGRYLGEVIECYGEFVKCLDSNICLIKDIFHEDGDREYLTTHSYVRFEEGDYQQLLEQASAGDEVYFNAYVDMYTHDFWQENCSYGLVKASFA